MATTATSTTKFGTLGQGLAVHRVLHDGYAWCGAGASSLAHRSLTKLRNIQELPAGETPAGKLCRKCALTLTPTL